MDKAILKKFAIESRQELMQKMNNKIKSYYIDEEFTKSQTGDIVLLSNDKHSLSLSKEEYAKRQTLIDRIKELGLEQVIEESSYTWFNRIVAIRYMEIHDYLPLTKDNQSLGIRVLSSKDNTPDPEILKFTNLTNPDLDIDFKKEEYAELKTDNDKFKYILLLICKKLGRVIPEVFDGVTDYIDILIPDNLLKDTGFIAKLINDIPMENYEQVELLGWLYQYYISERKSNLDKDLKNGKKAHKKDIPIKTQIFTPKEIVEFMVSNSFNNNDSIENKLKNNNLKNIKVYDPCCGSGHILIYAYEELFKIYKKIGYSNEDTSISILENNIYGTDIDERAVQLAILALLLRARADNKYLFKKHINLNIFEIHESNSISINDLDILINEKSSNKDMIEYLINEYNDAKIYGSLLNIKKFNYFQLLDTIEKLQNRNLNIFDTAKLNNIKKDFIYIIKQAITMSNKYDIVITNPPYLGRKNCDNKLCDFLDKIYPDSKMDMFSAFIKKNIDYCEKNGKIALMTPDTWLYLSSYKLLRKYIIYNCTFEKFLQPYIGYFNDAAVSICSFVLSNKIFDGIVEKYDLNLDGSLKLVNKIKMKKIKQIPDFRFVFDITDTIINIYKNDMLEKVCNPRQGMATTNNDLFLRKWYEVNFNKIGFNYSSEDEAEESKQKWFPYNKGGGNRKWYGNNEYMVNFENKGQTIANYIDNFSNSRVKSNGRIINREYFFKKSITWSDICGKTFSARACEKGFIFDVKGSSGFTNEENYLYILALLNSYVSVKLLNILNPTITTQVGDIKQIPYIFSSEYSNSVSELAKQNIEISKEDWDFDETSWNFENHPLIKWKTFKSDYADEEFKNNIESSFEEYKSNANAEFDVLKQNEEELNKIFIDIYGLQDELTPEESDKDVTIHKIFDYKEDIPEEMKNSQYALTKLDVIKSFISYAVGCMFGRYSLDENGLVYAGGEFDSSKYKTFEADADNIIPITEDKYFEDDIVEKFVKFVEVVYGKNTLEENLDFIANTLGKRTAETSRDTIRRYFLNDFYADHLKTYQKRPIYWLFDSGKKNGFKALIYMHRYNDQTVSKIRLDYLHKMQQTYATELKDVEYKLSNDLTLSEKKELTKKQADLNAKILETNEYDEKIAHIADQRISIDLDDGVAVNYGKFSVKNPKTGKEESILANSKDIVKKTKNSKEE